MTRPNLVLILTDTQAASMVGAYGQPVFDTPALDRLADEGLRCERAYTACPLCTPARGAIFSGLHPQVNGAWANEMSVARDRPLMGEIFAALGYRVGYTGKWHLDGAGYMGGGVAGGGFPQEWWYDGAVWTAEVGEDRRRRWAACTSAAELAAAGCREELVWGHRVADRACDFLARDDDRPFLLVVSFDEPHGPFIVPPAYKGHFRVADIPRQANFRAPLDGKPALQQQQAAEFPVPEWEEYTATRLRHFDCNRYIDREIGRVLDAVDARGRDDTLVVYTADHGDMLGSHGLRSKGAMMYEETVRVPFLVRGPGVEAGAVSRGLVSQVDILPTFLDLVGAPVPGDLHGVSQRAHFAAPDAPARERVLISFQRFGLHHDDHGAWYPIRCLHDGERKLALNLDDRDEFYDLTTDPGETCNRIDDPAAAAARERLHAELLAEMDRIRDPLRCPRWAERPWHAVACDRRYFGRDVNPP